MVARGSQQETLDPGFVLLGTRQQDVLKKSLSEKKEDLCFTQNTKSMKMFASHRTVFTNLNVYGQTYTGRSDRDFQIRVSEYVPKWLQKALKSNDQIGVDDKYPSSSIAKLTVETGYMIDRNSVYTRV
ncbi:unnamed protein product [Schistosoma curassoni]|uniref:DDE_Tnp_1_7 domain-containing protein n=1 Tax=Schistosoma curassoni TaxID=6186 RepID=A0A183JZM0_9TREM|nr:unnamed protein product [Schistosoma curassoni]